ncbi:hypothetical protein GCU56_01660 [Geodermatophilus sabuli]|uniref:DUF998 domain-containing protein n=1 Tax=Geodermatophilus sabuli TaxID=1564158 RepID=A0A7K3VW21_9ACTN|nr:hypothetical protein [Geodermatophilus sabuli]NEK56580.1 hypothetical protein [Geodermatophilus sabuli]
MRVRIQPVALGLVVAAVVPYIALKVVWLTGASIGVQDDTALAELHSTRMVVGNNLTILLELMAVGLALALSSGWGRRVPAWIMLSLGAGATGLLAPILLGLPIGSVLQLVVQGEVRTGGMEHLRPWVFAVVYGGFGLMAIGIVVLAARYAAVRWSHVLRRAPHPPPVWVGVAGGLGLVPFGAAMLWWGVSGPGSTGPQAMDAVVQRTTLVVTGLLAVAGLLAPLLPGISGRAPRLAWLAVWVGCTTAALQAPTHVLLADGGHPSRAMLLIGVLTISGSSIYGLLLLRRHLAHDRLHAA